MTGSALLNARQLLKQAGVSRNMHVADIGVGRTGHLVFPAADLVGEEGRVYGVDIALESLRMLEGRRRQFLTHNIDFVWADAEQGMEQIPTGSIDKVFLVKVLPLFSAQQQVIAELQRMLADDGQIIVVDWRPNAQHPVAPGQQFRISPQRADELFLRAGCEPCGDFAPSPWHWARVYGHDLR